MATTTQSNAKKRRPARKSAAAPRGRKDAVALLKSDHREVEKLFSQFEKAKDDAQKGELAWQICAALRVHTQIEEEIFYPTSRQFLDDEAIVDEALVEHAAAKELIGEIERMRPGEDLYDAKVKVLSEQIQHHVEEEETEYFPQVQKSDMDLKAIGQEMADRKQELIASMGAERTPH
jgi:hemerythrin superfamily protein